MRLDKNGLTIIEIIVSIVLISIVMLFLSILLIDVKDINDDSKTNSMYLINNVIFIKAVEEDLMNYAEIKIRTCDINAFSSFKDRNKFNECLEFVFDDTDIGYIGIYYHNTENKYVVSYIHPKKDGTNNKDVKNTYVLSEYEKYNLKNENQIKDGLKMSVKIKNDVMPYDVLSSTTATVESAITINLPIIGNDGKDYSIVIPYYGKVSVVG